LLVRAALASVARLAVLPLQDVLGLDGAHRMNIPGVAEDNWRWRFSWDQVQEEHINRLRDWIQLYGRKIY
jgi:4-alpha-glucanotransferase